MADPISRDSKRPGSFDDVAEDEAVVLSIALPRADAVSGSTLHVRVHGAAMVSSEVFVAAASPLDGDLPPAGGEAP